MGKSRFSRTLSSLEKDLIYLRLKLLSCSDLQCQSETIFSSADERCVRRLENLMRSSLIMLEIVRDTACRTRKENGHLMDARTEKMIAMEFLSKSARNVSPLNTPASHRANTADSFSPLNPGKSTKKTAN